MVKIDETDDLKNLTNPGVLAIFENCKKHSPVLTGYSNHIKIYFMELAERPAMEKSFSYIN
jgi:hypothetical protein